jgi:hypothetical protein
VDDDAKPDVECQRLQALRGDALRAERSFKAAQWRFNAALADEENRRGVAAGYALDIDTGLVKKLGSHPGG